MSLSAHHFRNSKIIILALFAVWALVITVNAGAATTINAGQSVVLDLSDELTCQSTSTGIVSTDATIGLMGFCETFQQNTTVDPRHQNIIAYTGGSSVGLSEPQRASATARLINEFDIPAVTAGRGVEVLPVQIATEVNWSGVLFAGGMNSAFAQVIGTLQVRDTTTGLVVASNTFLFERVDADFSLNVIDAIDGADITSSSGADITALLVRGRTYGIEVEVKCDVSVPVVGAAVCAFFDQLNTHDSIQLPSFPNLFGGDGFDVTNITVTLGTDAVSRIANN